MLTVLKNVYYFLREPIFKIRGYTLLDSKQTFALLDLYRIRFSPKNTLVLPPVNNAGHSRKMLFQENEASSEAMYVWKYQSDKAKVVLSKYGSVILDGQVLCTDESVQSFFRDIWKRDTRPTKQVPAMIALFSHYQDGILYGGYYDYIFFVVAKLCRIKDAFPEEDHSKMPISYPIFKTDYEKEFMALLGVDMNNVVDTRECKLISSTVVIGSGASWYPNIEDVLSLRRHILKNVSLIGNTGERVYISRSCRRKIVNEQELITLLKKFDLTVIEDIPRSVSEQISIYNNASFIIGPHGASFSNVVWCKPGAHLMELFSPNYKPDFFRYLAIAIGMNYSANYEESKSSSVDYVDGLVEDIYVSIPAIESYLNKVLA